jgi:hypothetical protein
MISVTAVGSKVPQMEKKLKEENPFCAEWVIDSY